MTKKILNICWVMSTILVSVMFTLMGTSVLFATSNQTLQIILFVGVFTTLVSLITVESIAAIYKCVK